MKMSNGANTKKQHYPTIWISDVHLGYKDCKADYLLDFLNSVESDTLYLVGDIIDLWSMKRQFYWHPSHYQVLSCIQQKAANGTRVIYIPGNHDETFRNYINQTLFGIEIHQQFIHTTKAKKQNVDGIICGHIHHPKIKVDDGIMYLTIEVGLRAVRRL